MGAFTIILVLIDVLAAIGLVALVLFQQGQARGLGAIAGGAETFFGKAKGRSIDAMLKKVTTVLAVIFLALTIALYLMTGRGV